jgi:hypothetical protein
MPTCGERFDLKNPKIINVRVLDLRFPASLRHIGSDAVNRDPDYSAGYCILETDADVEGHNRCTVTLMRRFGDDQVRRCFGNISGHSTHVRHASIFEDSQLSFDRAGSIH